MGVNLKEGLFNKLDLFINGKHELVLLNDFGKCYKRKSSIVKTEFKTYIDKIPINYCPICGRKLY